MKILSNTTLPNSMRALVLEEFGENPQLKVISVPIPGNKEILIKIDSSPVNPSDWAFLRGLYSSAKQLPVVPGFEGSGIVVATGKHLLAQRLLGKRVACFAPLDGNGTWAEYMVTNYSAAIPLSKRVDLEQGSMLIVNPLTVIAMMRIIKQRHLNAIVNTAAASALGQMLNKMCLWQGIICVNIVRRQEQVELLQSQGAKYIIDSSTEDFQKSLKTTLRGLKVKLAFDAVAGAMTFDLLKAMPSGGEVIVYGALAEEAIVTDPGLFIFENKRISGFWLSKWITHQHILKQLQAFKLVQKFLSAKHTTVIHKRTSLDEAWNAIQAYTAKMTTGKVLIKPGQNGQSD